MTLGQQLLVMALRPRLAQLPRLCGDGALRHREPVLVRAVALRFEERHRDDDEPAQLREQSLELFSRAPIAL